LPELTEITEQTVCVCTDGGSGERWVDEVALCGFAHPVP
jgi:hypothetical protein